MRSRKRARTLSVVVVGAAVPALLVACAQITGISDYDDRNCAGTGCLDVGLPDVNVPDARDASDGSSDVVQPDVIVDVSPIPEHRRWARWRMPNPNDAGVGSRTYLDATTASSGFPTVVDSVTGLEWEMDTAPASSALDAATHCARLNALRPAPGGWTVPTRIELASILDEGATPTIDPVFAADAGVLFWTATSTDKGGTFVIDFGTGAVQIRPSGGAAERVRCVRGVQR